MGQTSFTCCTNHTVTNAAIAANGKHTVFTSSTISNSGAYHSLRFVIEYSNPLPLDGGAVAITYSLSAILESQNGDNWFPIAYQFENFANPENGYKRIITMQPDIDTYNSGIDDVIYVGGATEARISRQQGKVGSSFRLRILCQENGFGSAGAFQSIVINAYGELYDA